MQDNKPSEHNPANDLGSEADIDALLAGAAELAAGLEQELGSDAESSLDPASGSAPPPDSPIPESKPASAERDPGSISSLFKSSDPAEAAATEQDADTSPELDAQFDQIESLLGQASDELRPGAKPEAERDQPEATEDPPAQTEETGELLEAAPPDTNDAADSLAEQLADLSDLGDPAELQNLPTLDPPEIPSLAEIKVETDLGEVGPIAEPASGPLWPAVHRAIDVLDVLDKPLGRLGPQARVVIGWLALAVLFAAACITALSALA